MGLFIIAATILVTAGFFIYIYHTGKRKGWFETKALCHTYLETATGVKVGDPVFMLGFPVGAVVEVRAMKPFYYGGNVFVSFEVRGENIGYIWDDSRVKVASADLLLGKRTIELIPGGGSKRKDLKVGFIQDKQGKIQQVWSREEFKYFDYTNGTKGYSIEALESPALGDRLESISGSVQAALPNVLMLTNQLSEVLNNTKQLTARLDGIVMEARPIVTNLAIITGQLKNPAGSLGDWLIPTNLNSQLILTLTNLNQTLGKAEVLLTNANTVVTNKDAELTKVLITLNESLDGLAGITSNLNVQVQSNTNLVKGVSDAIVHADDLLQGLKKHWLLRSAFKTNAPPKTPSKK